MIIGRKDRQRVERMKKTIAAQEEELRQKDEILSYKSALVMEYEEEIERLKAILAAKEEKLCKRHKIIAYKNAIIRTHEEEIEILKETNLKMRERIRELEGKLEKKEEEEK